MSNTKRLSDTIKKMYESQKSNYVSVSEARNVIDRNIKKYADVLEYLKDK